MVLLDARIYKGEYISYIVSNMQKRLISIFWFEVIFAFLGFIWQNMQASENK